MPVQKFRSIEEMNKAPLPESRGSDFERSCDTVPVGGPLLPNSIHAVCSSSALSKMPRRLARSICR
jgi:hypothetical protein